MTNVLYTDVYYRSLHPQNGSDYFFTRYYSLKYEGSSQSVYRAAKLGKRLEKRYGFPMLLMYQGLPLKREVA